MSQSPTLDQVPPTALRHEDAANLIIWLQQNLEGFKPPLTLEALAGGQSNPTLKLITPSRNYVLRMKPGPRLTLLPSAHAIEREYRVMRALAASHVPVPAVYCLCEDESVIGRAFYVMECIDGRVFWDQALPGMARSERSAIYDEMVRTIAALHTTDIGSRSLSTFGRPGNYFERQIARWTAQVLATPALHGGDPAAAEEMARLMEWLPSHIPSEPGEPRLAIVHGDYRMDNLMFHPREPRILGVLDWELSTLGHPLADFSYHCMSWNVAHGPGSRGIGGLDIAGLGIPSERQYIDRYCALTGFATSADLLTNWNFYLAYNMFRMAAILQGIAVRAESGTAANPVTATGADRMARLGWSFAQRA